MSEITLRSATGNHLTADSDRSKVFIGNNEFEVGTLLNATAGELTYEIGTVLGKVAASNRLVPLASAGTDGSQYPIGILAEEVTLAASGTASVNICIAGDVNASSIILGGTDVLTTVVEDKTIADRIKSDNKGIRLITINDGTFFDN